LAAVVLLGGVVGTPLRYAVGLALPTRPGAWPGGTLAVNLLGAFLLGVLLETLVRRGSDAGGRRLLRLGLGTGILGSFTTYSTLAVETDLLLHAARPGLAAAYALVSVGAGLLASGLGIAAGAARHRRGHG
jgi:CrcB protein